MRAIYSRAAQFKRGNLSCKLYYVTTGKWENDQSLIGRSETVTADLKNTDLFSDVDFYPIGKAEIQKLYAQAKNAIAREFVFQNRTVVSAMSGVADAYLGLIPAAEALKILTDEDGEIVKSIFYDNVRDWQNFNDVNDEIRRTLESPDATRFALMNNGITIIARHLQPTGNTFHIEDFQIVNGWIPRRLRSDHCVLRRRYNHIQGLPIPFPQQIPCGRSILGAVSQKARDRSIELIQEPG